MLPNTWSRQNPIDIIGDANASRYAKALTILMDSMSWMPFWYYTHLRRSVKALKSPMPWLAWSTRIRKRIALIFWPTGAAKTLPIRRENASLKGGISTYRTPEGAVGAFMHMVEYRRNQKLLQEVPQSIPDNILPIATRRAHYCKRLAKGEIGTRNPRGESYFARLWTEHDRHLVCERCRWSGRHR